MESQNVPLDKAALMERIEQSWTALDQDICQMSEEQLSRPGTDGGWSVKDHLVHLTVWEQKQLAVVEGRPAHEGLGVDAASYAANDVDTLNTLIYQRHKEQHAADVVARFHQTHGQLIAALRRLSAADLARPEMPGLDGGSNSLMDGVMGNTYEHYDEHRAWIAELVSQTTETA